MSINARVGRMCDTHVHVFDPKRHPYSADRTYTPGSATIEHLRAFLGATGTERVVLVQPSVYGSDNAALMDALGVFGSDRARGIAVIDPYATTDAEIETLREAGVRGLRVNVAVDGTAARPLRDCIDRAAAHGLAIEIYADMSFVSENRSVIETSPVPVILDHYAGIDPTLPESDSGLDLLVEILGSDNVWVKMSAPYRLPGVPSVHAIETLTSALAAARVDRLLWASDWPHTGRLPRGTERTDDSIDPFQDVDDVAVLAAVQRAAGSTQNIERIFVTNPAELFGF